MLYRNWCKTVIRSRAYPMSADLAKGMACVCLVEGQPRLAVAYLLSFLGLLRVSEILTLRVSDLKLISGSPNPFVSFHSRIGTGCNGFSGVPLWTISPWICSDHGPKAVGGPGTDQHGEVVRCHEAKSQGGTPPFCGHH